MQNCNPTSNPILGNCIHPTLGQYRETLENNIGPTSDNYQATSGQSWVSIGKQHWPNIRPMPDNIGPILGEHRRALDKGWYPTLPQHRADLHFEIGPILGNNIAPMFQPTLAQCWPNIKMLCGKSREQAIACKKSNPLKRKPFAVNPFLGHSHETLSCKPFPGTLPRRLRRAGTPAAPLLEIGHSYLYFEKTGWDEWVRDTMWHINHQQYKLMTEQCFTKYIMFIHLLAPKK